MTPREARAQLKAKRTDAPTTYALLLPQPLRLAASTLAGPNTPLPVPAAAILEVGAA